MRETILDKFGYIFKYIVSSSITIEILIFCLLLFALLIVNLRRKNVFINIGFIGIYFGLLIGVLVSYNDYVKLCFRSTIKGIMHYIYFPSTIVYFFIMMFVCVMTIYTIFNSKVTKFKKVFNYICFSLIYLLFLLFVTLSASNEIELNSMKELYTNSTILSLVQISNLILLIWILFTLFYRLYCYFKKKYD